MLLVDWIMQFNDMMERGNFPFEKLFRDHDSTQTGGLTFQDFIGLNEFVGVSITKKDLLKIFNIIDKDRSGVINMFEVKEMSKLTWKEDPANEEQDAWLKEDEDLKGEDIMIKEQVKDVYEDLKNKLEAKNVTLEQIIYNDMQINQMQLVTIKGL